MGGYGTGDRIAVGQLVGDKLQVTALYRLALPDGEQVPPRAEIIGRGPELHVFTEDTWYRLSLDALSG